MLKQNLLLAWQLYQQQSQLTHYKLLRYTQLILLTFITTLTLTSSNIQHYLKENLQSLLGADAVISQQQSLTGEQYLALKQLSKEIITTQQVTTTISHNERWQQVKLKAVPSSYPLQGHLITSATEHFTSNDQQQTKQGPLVGQIWLEARLLSALSLKLGDTLNIANQAFVVSHILVHEPDRLMEGHNVDMRAMINTQDLNNLQLPASLIEYRYLIAANKIQVNAIIEWQQQHLPAAQLHHQQGHHPLALFWQRTENFLGLASIILFFMAAIAIEQLTQVHMQKDRFFAAVSMSFGASKNTGMQISIIKWLIGILSIIPAAITLSLVLHASLIYWLGNTFTGISWQWQLGSTLMSMLAICTIFMVFHLPVWLAISRSSVSQLFLTNKPSAATWISKCCSLLVLCFVAFAYSDNGLLTVMVLTAMIITILLILVISWFALTAGEKLSQHFSGLMPFTLFMMKQRLVSKSTQILGIGLASFLLLFTLMLLKDLGATMTAYQRQHDGNVLISRATDKQMSDIDKLSTQHGFTIRQSKPYFQAKLIEVNNTLLVDFTNKPSDSLATLKKSIRLHFTPSLPENNRVVEGTWWPDSPKNWQQVSVEQEVMTDLGLVIGDKLTLMINQQPMIFTIAASHVFKPGAGSITFWLQIPFDALNHIDAPKYSMASLEVTDEQWQQLTSLWQQHPTLRIVSLQEMTERFDSILAMITQVISGFSFLILLLASIVILASIQAMESKEKKKNSIILSFGFTHKTCVKLNLIEWTVTACIAASGAILGTYIAGLLIYQSQFSLTYNPSIIWLISTLMIIGVSVTALGTFASKSHLKSSIKQLMADH